MFADFNESCVYRFKPTSIHMKEFSELERK